MKDSTIYENRDPWIEENITNNDDFTDVFSLLDLGKNKKPKNSMTNLMIICQNDRQMKMIYYDTFSRTYVIDSDDTTCEFGEDGPLEETAFSSITRYLEKNYSITLKNKKDISDRILLQIREIRKINSLQKWLLREKWDGIPRIEKLLIDFLGAEDCQMTRIFTRKWFISAAARAMEPGCKADNVLVLTGRQGIGKTVFFETIGSRFYTGDFSLGEIDSKDGKIKLQSSFIVEFSELAGISKKDNESIKSFLTRREDNYRPLFDHFSGKFPRHCAFCATTNEDFFLRDPTGNRRWWPIVCQGNTKPVSEWKKELEDILPQLWAEAMYLYKENESWWLNEKEIEDAEKIQNKYSTAADDEYQGLLINFLEKEIPWNWEKLSDSERANFYYLKNEDFNTHKRDYVCVAEIKKYVSELRNFSSQRIGKMLDLVGWERSTKKKKVPSFGEQRIWIRSIKQTEKEQTEQLDGFIPKDYIDSNEPF